MFIASITVHRNHAANRNLQMYNRRHLNNTLTHTHIIIMYYVVCIAVLIFKTRSTAILLKHLCLHVQHKCVHVCVCGNSEVFTDSWRTVLVVSLPMQTIMRMWDNCTLETEQVSHNAQ